MRGPFALLVVGALALTACSNDDDTAADTTTAVTESPTVTEPPATEPPTTNPTSTEAPSSGPNEIPVDGPVPAGDYLTTKPGGSDLPVSLTLPENTWMSLSGRGLVALIASPDNPEGVFSMFNVANARVFNTPTARVEATADPSYLAQVTDPAPADLLAWYQTLPGFILGPIEDTTVGGEPARSMRFELGPFPDMPTCPPTDVPCQATYDVTSAYVIATTNVGQSGTFYEVIVDGVNLFIEVFDTPGAQEVFDSISFAS